MNHMGKCHSMFLPLGIRTGAAGCVSSAGEGSVCTRVRVQPTTRQIGGGGNKGKHYTWRAARRAGSIIR